ncbi:MAG: hypothetical protein IID45_06295, partial [Planctomycetes bacterium]|nr:hypothetical protein [Planctomycetota bacterium]
MRNERRSCGTIAAVVLLAAFLSGCESGGESPAASSVPKSQEVKQEVNTSKPKSANVPKVKLQILPDDGDSSRVVVTVSFDDAALFQRLRSQVDHTDLANAITLRLSQTDRPSAIPAATTGPSMFGRLDVDVQGLRFHPAVSLVPGETYVAAWDPSRFTAVEGLPRRTMTRIYRVPVQKASPPRILAIYPSGDRLPANHLKFYLRFSEPMRQEDVFRYFHLENLTTGKRVLRPFRHTELWSHDGLRFTLWFHPGRQKPGVNLNVELGPILIKGNRYRLVVSAAWNSEKGVPLGDVVQKTFTAADMDDIQPAVSNWSLNSPKAGTREPLVCRFPQPLDWALLHSELRIEQSSGERMPGRIEVGKDERTWSFHPAAAWQPGRYRLMVNSLLEDLAGNSIERKFNVDLSKRAKPSIAKTVA